MALFVHRTTRDVITVSGPDAATYLQGQLSQDVDTLVAGSAASTFVLAPQGKVEGWGRVQRTDDDRFVIDADVGAGQVWVARLRRFLLRTKADVELSEDVATTAVRGSDTGVAPAGAVPAGWPGLDGWDLVGDAAGAPVPDEATELDAETFDALRIRAGVPRWGAEIDPATIPATLGQWVIDTSVSFTKGCYTGQELVARIDSRGGNVPRRLVGAVIDGDAPAVGAEVTVGESSWAIISSAHDEAGAVALLFLPRSVEVPVEGWLRHGSAGAPPAQPSGGGRRARLVDLPMR